VDLVERPELDGRAERVADGAGQQRSPDPLASLHGRQGMERRMADARSLPWPDGHVYELTQLP
jgi:hypothetical protein